MHKDLDDGDNLTKFFSVLQRYNKGVPFNQELKKRIEVFFDYKWNNDRLLAIDDQDEIDKLNQLPEAVQDKLITNFLFSTFLNNFMDFFRCPKKVVILGATKVRSFFTWKDE